MHFRRNSEAGVAETEWARGADCRGQATRGQRAEPQGPVRESAFERQRDRPALGFPALDFPGLSLAAAWGMGLRVTSEEPVVLGAVFASRTAINKAPHTGDLKQRTVTFSQSGRPEVQNQGVGRVAPSGGSVGACPEPSSQRSLTLLGVQPHRSSLCLHCRTAFSSVSFVLL